MMKQEQINYSDIVELGFKIEPQNDEIYFNQYGFEYCIITKKLTNLISNAAGSLLYVPLSHTSRNPK